jgi:hypothetical protein
VTSLVKRMMIVSDETPSSVTYNCHSDRYRAVIYDCNIFRTQATDVHTFEGARSSAPLRWPLALFSQNSLPDTNDIAYVASPLLTKKKNIFITLTRCQCYKTFFFVETRPNKLECLYLAITFQSSLTFADNTRSLPKKEASERSSNWVCSGLALKF